MVRRKGVSNVWRDEDMITDFLNYWFYEPMRILFLIAQIRHTDRTLHVERHRKAVILESIAHDEAVLARLKDELMQLERGRA